MALFGKKKSTDQAGETAEAETQAPQAFSAEKASTFFKHAQIKQDTGNYDYAMQLWLNGLGQDPRSMEGLEKFLRAAQLLAEQGGSKNAAKEISKGLTAKGHVGKYLDGLLAFGVRLDDGAAALKAAEYAANLGLEEPTGLLGRLAVERITRDKKAKKDLYVRLLDVLEQGNEFDLAARIGDAAVRMDPSDGPLQARVRDMMAKATMRSGGFDQAGEEGGFRKSIRDADAQRRLEEADRIVKTEDVKDRLVKEAEENYKLRPEDLPTIDAYGKALLDRGAKNDELKAMTLYTKAYETTSQFRFRQKAGEIKLRMGKRRLRALEQKLEANPDHEELKQKVEQGRAQYAKWEMEELQLRVENYPTDLAIKYELGLIHLNRGEYDEAIALFQVAKDDAKNRVRVLNSMATAFLKLGGWEDQAIEVYRQAIDLVENQSSDLGTELRYGLMVALQDKAEAAKDLEAAEEADKLAGAIAIQQFNYRDIKERREAIKAIMASLREG